MSKFCLWLWYNYKLSLDGNICILGSYICMKYRNDHENCFINLPQCKIYRKLLYLTCFISNRSTPLLYCEIQNPLPGNGLLRKREVNLGKNRYIMCTQFHFIDRLSLVHTPDFSCAESNANEPIFLFEVICIFCT